MSNPLVSALAAACLSLLLAAACSPAPSTAMGSAASAERTDDSDDDDGSSKPTLDPSYVEHWVIAPGTGAELGDLVLASDGSYTAQTKSGAESGTWSVIDLGGDWIFNHTLTLAPKGATARVYGSEFSNQEGYAALYPNEDAHLGFTMLSKARVDALPATCDFDAQNCGFKDVLQCIPSDTHLTGGTCVAAWEECFAEAGCADPAKSCIIPHSMSWGFCLPRAADVPSCNVDAQDCADSSLVCMPHDSSEKTGFCQRSYMPCTSATGSDCSFYGGTCLSTAAGRSFCVRNAG